MPTSTFGKSQRLLTASEFQRVFDKSEYRVSERYFLFLAMRNFNGNTRLGLIIGKKNIRLAVQRNRIKRIVRESFRTQKHGLPAIDIIFLARRGLDKTTSVEFARTLTKALLLLADRIGKG